MRDYAQNVFVSGRSGLFIGLTAVLTKYGGKMRKPRDNGPEK